MIETIVSASALGDLDAKSAAFASGDPFRHVLITDFLQPAFLDRILEEFPEPEPEKLVNEFGGPSKKHAVHDIARLGPAFLEWHRLLQSPEFIAYIERITGIEGLLFDPEYHGAGTHNNLNGQGMDAHIDFNLHRTTNYHRRLNLIVYINREWDPSWGGNLELHKDPWDRVNDYFKTYPPHFNHAVIFETNEHSWHGFDTITLPDDKAHLSRKSLTVYYYSKERPAEEIAPKHGTIYVQKGVPDSIKPTQVVSREAYRELRQLIHRRDQYLKALYTRESNLLVRIQHLEDKIRRLEAELAKHT